MPDLSQECEATGRKRGGATHVPFSFFIQSSTLAHRTMPPIVRASLPTSIGLVHPSQTCPGILGDSRSCRVGNQYYPPQEVTLPSFRTFPQFPVYAACSTQFSGPSKRCSLHFTSHVLKWAPPKHICLLLFHTEPLIMSQIFVLFIALLQSSYFYGFFSELFWRLQVQGKDHTGILDHVVMTTSLYCAPKVYNLAWPLGLLDHFPHCLGD